MPCVANTCFRIAVLLNITDQPARDIIGGIGDYARAHGPWQFKHVQRRPDWPKVDLRELAIDGVLAQISQPERQRSITLIDRPTVNMANSMAGAPLPSVLCDDVAVGRMAREHFAERGYVHLAFCGPRAFEFSRERLAGFAGSVGIPIFWLPEPYQMDELSEETRRQFGVWLQQLPKPLGIFAATDRYARLVIECCTSMNIAVPDDIAVLGVNNDPIDCELTEVPVSSIQLDAKRQGRDAAAMLHALLLGSAAPSAPRRIIPERVVTRRSTDTLAVTDEVVLRALQLLRANATVGITVGALARQVGVSRRTLEVRFRRALSRSPYAELLRLRVNLARDELRVKDRRVSEIAERCGFGESRCLEQHFRRATGMTPTAYRRSLD